VSFFYTIVDSDGLTATESVLVNVLPVNDPPVAVADMLILDEDSSDTVQVLDNDSDVDGDALEILSFTETLSGTLFREDTELLYTPDLNFHGIEVVDYVIVETDRDDGTTLLTATARITFEVQPVNDIPVAADDIITATEDETAFISILSNDLDVDGDLLIIESIGSAELGDITINNNVLVYVPRADIFGTDTFTYTIADPSLAQSTATVTVNVQPVPDPPVAVDDAIQIDEDTTISIPVLDNDLDIDVEDGRTSTVVLDSLIQPANGEAQKDDDRLIYTPTLNFNGIDTLSYTIVNDDGLVATATVVITVTSVNDRPIAVDDEASVQEDQSVVLDVLDNDSDIEDDVLRITSVDGRSCGYGDSTSGQ